MSTGYRGSSADLQGDEVDVGANGLGDAVGRDQAQRERALPEPREGHTRIESTSILICAVDSASKVERRQREKPGARPRVYDARACLALAYSSTAEETESVSPRQNSGESK